MARTIDLRTDLPGPRSAAILERKQRVIADAKSIYLPIVIDRAHGIAVTDVDGNTFLDSPAASAASPSGTPTGRVAAVHRRSTASCTPTSRSCRTSSYVELAERLMSERRSPAREKAAFFNTGAEAVENAVKFAKLATGRPAVIAFERAFHGRT